MSGLEPRVLVGTLLLGSGEEEEEPSCRGGGAAGKVAPSPPRGCSLFVPSLRYPMFSLGREEWGCWQEGLRLNGHGLQPLAFW